MGLNNRVHPINHDTSDITYNVCIGVIIGSCFYIIITILILILIKINIEEDINNSTKIN